MRVIPVIDLLNGSVVHAVKGERQKYRPVQSLLSCGTDPISIARSFRDTLGLGEIYIADLNAIQFNDGMTHRELIAGIAANEKINLILDAGISEIEDALAWTRQGIHKVVIGSETLSSLRLIREVPEKVERDRLVFSLDLKFGRVLSRSVKFSSLSPMEAIGELVSAGWTEIIILDLGRVGSGSGIDLGAAGAIMERFPDLHLLLGGGLASRDQLAELHRLGIAGVLTATALHRGTVTRQDISKVEGNPRS